MHIDEYLTEEIMKNILNEIFKGATEKSKESPDSNELYERTWSSSIETNNEKLVINYDDYEHYCNAVLIKTDNEEEEIAKELGYKVIRIPYWIQLDSITVKHYFGVESDIKTEYLHGFGNTSVFPASFCEKGIERFSQELKMLPGEIKYEIIMSLREKIKEHGTEYVIPKSLKII